MNFQSREGFVAVFRQSLLKKQANIPLFISSGSCIYALLIVQGIQVTICRLNALVQQVNFKQVDYYSKYYYAYAIAASLFHLPCMHDAKLVIKITSAS